MSRRYPGIRRAGRNFGLRSSAAQASGVYENWVMYSGMVQTPSLGRVSAGMLLNPAWGWATGGRGSDDEAAWRGIRGAALVTGGDSITPDRRRGAGAAARTGWGSA